MKYKNIFNLSDALAQTITNIINKQENSDYRCRIIDITIPTHTKEELVTPFEQNQDWGGPSLSGAELRHLTEKYGWYEKKIIPEQEFSYLVIMNKSLIENFYNTQFSSKGEIEKALANVCRVHQEYDGVFDCNIMLREFPYLKPFFETLDDWREQTGRLVLDSTILEKGIYSVFNNFQNYSADKEEKTL